ncbi:hypothetical protein GL263_10145 [Streptomyces durbertensis]|uniref:Uncharacterized protein n=1 Tax=Streptomyces durbertensis TaxID=2448886 RepID=A0ABR6EHD6_9ACTN|nr:hypothetical protein [Streptomyces durbertensis]MBB1243914.1 hypothetical protein [Streptomyces durbertensis]
MKKRSMLAIASFAVGVVASLATPTVQPSQESEAKKDDGRSSAPDLALGAAEGSAEMDGGKRDA